MERQGVERKLTTILSADVAGYSRLMGEDEEATLKTLNAYREVIDGLIAGHRGRVFSSAGDSVVAEFASAVEAVRCAIEAQRELEERNAELAENRRMRFRIGVNLGDVMVEGDNLFGDGVNVAARLQALAEPGGICLSRPVFDQVKNRLELDYEYLGEQDVKNIAEPVRAYRVRVEPAAPAVAGRRAESESEPALELADKPSIAVLPFVNMSGEAEQEYFADGICEDIITALSYQRQFPIIARNSTFAYKGRSLDIKQVGQELGARYVLEGSVRKGGNRVRISAQLIDARSGNHVWAQRYDRELDDIFAVQDEITETIVAAIEPELGTAERERVRRIKPESYDAWDCFQRGMSHLYRFTAEDNAEARTFFTRAIERDPGFAAGFAGLAYTHYLDFILAFGDAPAESLDKAFDAARKAVGLDDRDALARFTLGRVYTVKGDLDSAIPELETAIRLNPSSALAHHGLGFTLMLDGRMEEALARVENAIRLSPYDPYLWVFLTVRAALLNFLERFDEAVDTAKKAIRQPNAGFWPYANLAAALMNLGRIDEARSVVAKLLDMNPEFSEAFIRRTLPFKNPGDLQRYIDALSKAGVPA